MEKIIKKQDWYESVDSDVDYNQINKSNLISRYTNNVEIIAFNNFLLSFTKQHLKDLLLIKYYLKIKIR